MDKKYESCSLPYDLVTDNPFTGDSSYNWITYNNELITNYSLYESMSDIIRYGFIYHYETEEQDTEYHSHGHSYEDVLRTLYYYPEHFHIPNDSLHEYSNQELKFIKRMKSYLLLIGLKNLKPTETEQEMEEQKLSRSNNELARKYSLYGFYEPHNRSLKDILNGKYNYLIRQAWDNKYEEEIGKKLLLFNEEQDILGELTITDVKLMNIDDLNEDILDLSYYESLDKFKEELKERYQYSRPSFENKIIYLTYTLKKY